MCVIKKDAIETFHNHLKQHYTNIKFRLEMYSVGLIFLDTLNKVSENGSISISIYRKNTNEYLDFSQHPSSQKVGSYIHSPIEKKNFWQGTILKEKYKRILQRSWFRMGTLRPIFIKRHSTIRIGNHMVFFRAIWNRFERVGFQRV